MKISVITPSLNQGRFLEECIRSVQEQRGVAWEHIVVDAGSTDGTLEILANYSHLKWASEPDCGMSDGINKGFLQATGDWLMWLNTDDFLLPGALEKIARHSEAEPQADIIYGECIYVDKGGNMLRRRADHRFDRNILLFYGCYIQSTATFIHRRVIEAGHLLDLRYKNCMDFEYYLRLSMVGAQFSFIPEALAAFRWHDSNTSTRFAGRRAKERLEIQRTALRKLGVSWLGSEWMLAILKRIYQAKRLVLRKTSRHV